MTTYAINPYSRGYYRSIATTWAEAKNGPSSLISSTTNQIGSTKGSFDFRLYQSMERFDTASVVGTIDTAVLDYQFTTIRADDPNYLFFDFASDSFKYENTLLAQTALGSVSLASLSGGAVVPVTLNPALIPKASAFLLGAVGSRMVGGTAPTTNTSSTVVGNTPTLHLTASDPVPVITSADTVDAIDGQPLAHSLTATNGPVTWSIVGGADASAFEISGSTLREAGNVNSTFDSEDRERTVIVRATNAQGTDDQTITVTSYGTFYQDTLDDLNPDFHWSLNGTTVDSVGGHSTTSSGTAQYTGGLISTSNADAARFDTANGFLLNPANDPRINAGTGYAFTKRSVNLFVRLDDVQTKRIIWEQGGGTNWWGLYVSGGQLIHTIGEASATGGFNSVPISADTTYMVTLTVDLVAGTNNLRLYLDGVQADADNSSVGTDLAEHTGDVELFGTSDIRDTSNSNTGFSRFEGEAQSFAYWTERALTASEIAGLWQAATTGQPPAISGSVSKTLGSLTSVSASRLALAATSSKAFAPLLGAGAGKVAIEADAAKALGALSGSAQARVEVRAAANATFVGLEGTAEAELFNEADANASFAPLLAVSSAQLSKIAQVSSTFTPLAGSSYGERVFGGVTNVTFAPLTSSSVSEVGRWGSSSPTFASLAGAGQGFQERLAAAIKTLAPMSSASQAELGRVGNTSSTFAPLTGSGQSWLERRASAAKTFAPLTAVSNAELGRIGQVSKLLAAMTSSSAAVVDLKGQASKTLSPLSSNASAELLAGGRVNVGFASLTGNAAASIADKPEYGLLYSNFGMVKRDPITGTPIVNPGQVIYEGDFANPIQ